MTEIEKEMEELLQRLEDLFFRIQSTKKEMHLPYKESNENIFDH